MSRPGTSVAASIGPITPDDIELRGAVASRAGAAPPPSLRLAGGAVAHHIPLEPTEEQLIARAPIKSSTGIQPISFAWKTFSLAALYLQIGFRIAAYTEVGPVAPHANSTVTPPPPDLVLTPLEWADILIGFGLAIPQTVEFLGIVGDAIAKKLAPYFPNAKMLDRARAQNTVDTIKEIIADNPEEFLNLLKPIRVVREGNEIFLYKILGDFAAILDLKDISGTTNDPAHQVVLFTKEDGSSEYMRVTGKHSTNPEKTQAILVTGLALCFEVLAAQEEWPILLSKLVAFSDLTSRGQVKTSMSLTQAIIKAIDTIVAWARVVYPKDRELNALGELLDKSFVPHSSTSKILNALSCCSFCKKDWVEPQEFKKAVFNTLNKYGLVSMSTRAQNNEPIESAPVNAPLTSPAPALTIPKATQAASPSQSTRNSPSTQP